MNSTLENTNSTKYRINQGDVLLNEKLSGVPSEYRKDEYETFNRLELSGHRNYLIHGAEFNTGKTISACRNALRLIGEGFKVKFFLFSKMNKNFMNMQSFDRTSDDFRKSKTEINTAFKQNILILDDAFDPRKSTLWKSESSDMLIANWDEFLRDFLSNGGKVWLTSNKSKSEIESKYGAAIVALFDKWNFECIEIFKPDFIKKERSEN